MPSADQTNAEANQKNPEESSSIDSEEATGRMVMNVYSTEYEVVQKVARKSLGFKLREYREDHDGAIRRG